MRKLGLLFCLFAFTASAQQLAPLTVEKIMRDQKWIGVSPSAFRWSADSKRVFFNWNPKGAAKAGLYQVNVASGKTDTIKALAADEAVGMSYVYNKDRSMGLAEKGGDIYCYELKTGKARRLTKTEEYEGNPMFLSNGNIAYQKGSNFFELNLKTSETRQLSNIVKGNRGLNGDKKAVSKKEEWLKQQQTELFDVLRNKKADQPELPSAKDTGAADKKMKPVYIGEKTLSDLVLSPDAHYLSYKLREATDKEKRTIVPSYVTASGYTEDLNTRAKVGETPAGAESYIYDLRRDTVYRILTAQIPGIKDLPDYLKDYPAALEERKKKNADRIVELSAPNWNESGTAAVVVAASHDNKDLWLLKLDAASGGLSLVDRQRDEAWIGGPGAGELQWLDNDRVYYRSEASGYAHIYVADIHSGKKKQLTSGNWEVQSLRLSKDKQRFYFSANKEHPGISHFYSMDVTGGNLQQLTSMKGGNEVLLSPDEKWLAINYSYMNKPWELYVQPNKAGAKAKKITSSTTAEFNSYNWREPDLVSFKNRYGDEVYARVYPAKTPHPNRPAVVFVHGAGYLQNVHYWWSQYSREYMFNNMLADNGYTVIDIDYTASSGYGRKHRTGIYRHMGGKDLSDQVDGVKMLVEKYGVNPKHVGLYGGSYGGFITLMALFKEQEVFASGAALRSVTDWAHYNHGYTSNILNEPYNDELAYKRSSPIYFADGLKGNLLMCHGMVDVNVHFQDIVRLSQRLIELGKNNWELAVYPVEDHGFTTPSGWTDEYKRIYKLFESTLKNP